MRNSILPKYKYGRQGGATMVEFAAVGPVVILLGLAVLQYGLMFFAKNQMNNAAFLAARAGSTGNANMQRIQDAYAKALIPMFGGGSTSGELANAFIKAKLDVTSRAKIVLLNPTKEAFDDWSDPTLQSITGGGKRVIPNAWQASMDPNKIGANSGETIQDANLIKVQVMHGYEPKVPLIGTIYKAYLKWMDPHTDATYTAFVNDGLVPIVTSAVVQMQSDAIEDQVASIPGMGNSGAPKDPGVPAPVVSNPPSCLTIGCTVPSVPVVPANPTDPAGGSETPTCTGEA